MKTGVVMKAGGAEELRKKDVVVKTGVELKIGEDEA